MTNDLWKALAYLYPNADPLRDYQISDEGDGLGPRIAYWGLPGSPPTEAQITAAIAAYDTQKAQEQQDASQLRQLILATAQSAVGMSIAQLTAAQVRSLEACLLWKAGAIDKNGVVKPLGDWL